MNSTRRAFSLSSIAVFGWVGAVATLPPDAMAQAQAPTPTPTPTDLDSRVKAFLDQRRTTWSEGINYWNVRHEDGQALHDPVFQDADKEWYLRYWSDLKGKVASKGCYAADNVLRPAAREVSQFVEAARRDPAFRTRIDDLGSGEGMLLACRN